MPNLDKLDAVLIKDCTLDAWTVHLVQLDIAAQGKTIEDALKEVQFTLAAATARAAKDGAVLTDTVGSAPEEYRDRFQRGTRLDVVMPPVPHIDPPLPVAVPTIAEARVV